jgi:enoyl-CoA hydratase/carnithine racemase
MKNIEEICEAMSTSPGTTSRERPMQTTIEKGVAKILIERRPVNAFNFAFYGQMTDALAELAVTEGIGCLLIGSAIEKIFSAGADINDFKAQAAKPDSGEAREAAVTRFQHAIREFPYPTIAVVDGAAIGAGCVLATLCDIRVISSRAWFTIPEIDVTRVGGAHHTRRLLPEGEMRKLFYTAQRLSAERAYQLGFAQELVEPDRVWGVANEMATTIAGKSPIGLRLGKRAINDTEDMALWEAYNLEQQFSYRLSRIDAARLLGPSEKTKDA